MACVKATRYCRYENTLCEFATEHGYCQKTACTKQKPQGNMSNLKDEIAETLYDFNVQSDVTIEELADMIADIFKKYKDGEPHEQPN